MVKDIRQYRWAQNFHKFIWNQLLKNNEKIPKYTIEQLSANGWYITSITKGIVTLKHNDGDTLKFVIYVDGAPMPNSRYLFASFLGITLDIYPGWWEETKSRILDDYVGLGAELNGEVIRMNAVEGWPSKFITKTPLNESYPYPKSTTSEEFVNSTLYRMGNEVWLRKRRK